MTTRLDAVTLEVLWTRIISVVDVYDALRTRRPYKPPLEDAEALKLLYEGVRTGQLDPEVVRVFAEIRTEAVRSRTPV